MFRIREGSRRWREGSVSLTVKDGRIETTYFRTGAFTQAVRSCRIRRSLKSYQVLNRRLRASGYLGCHDGPASLIRDLYYAKPGTTSVSFHGTNRAGFEDAVRFRCRITGRRGRYTARCANKLGDRFIHSYTLRRR
jgi:hypothetical protein